MGACALILLVLPATAQSQSDADLNRQLMRHLSTMKKDKQVIVFLKNHQWLFSDSRFAASAQRQRRVHTMSLQRTQRKAAAARRTLALHAARRARERRLAAVEAAKPQNVICRVFGDHCREALAVSGCESGWSTNAQNGQYLGLFQMGSMERQLFGHGPTARAQAVAARRYFVRSGRDWSPWSCRWAAL